MPDVTDKTDPDYVKAEDLVRDLISAGLVPAVPGLMRGDEQVYELTAKGHAWAEAFEKEQSQAIRRKL